MWAIDMPRLYKYLFVGILVTAAVAESLFRKRSLKELGLRLDNLKVSLLVYGIAAMLLSTAIYLAYLSPNVRASSQPAYTIGFLAFYFLVSSPGQEFLFRSWLFYRMKEVGISSVWSQSLLAALAFGILHIHHYDWLTFSVAFIFGLIWATLFHKYPNFFSASLFHGILGVIAVMTRLI
jgi:membrane protease YdiL (CAAX protease family)